MSFIRTPLSYIEPSLRLVRDLDNRIAMLDNLVELIVFTPRGTFASDPDFGFDYWNYEFSNVHYQEFNSSQGASATGHQQSNITKKECEDSVKQSLATYEPMLQNVTVSIELTSAYDKGHLRKKMPSKFELSVIVTGYLDNGLGTKRPYRKIVVFYVEPTAKRYK